MAPGSLWSNTVFLSAETDRKIEWALSSRRVCCACGADMMLMLDESQSSRVESLSHFCLGFPLPAPAPATVH